MVAHPGEQLDGVGKFHQVIIGPGFEGGFFDAWVFFGGEDEHRDFLQLRAFAVGADEFQAIHAWHHQILENDHGQQFAGGGEGQCGIRAEVKIKAGLGLQNAPDRLTNDGLVIDEEDHGVGWLNPKTWGDLV